MKFSSIKFKILKKLFRNSRLCVFKPEGNSDSQKHYSLKEKILLHKTFQKRYGLQFAYLKHFMGTTAYSEGAECFGAVDFAEPVENNSYAIRGWIFCPESRIKQLFLFVEDKKYQIYAFHLNRMDVHEKLGFLENSSDCGFVYLIEGCDNPEAFKNIRFEAHTIDNKIHNGRF